MNAEWWEKAKDIFEDAIELPLEARSGYLSQACGEDTPLRLEVDGLLAADAELGSFLDPGWLAPFSPFTAVTPQPEFELAPGDMVSGRFKIVRPLGDGGMGRVYEAHDSVLGVAVALKTLRPEISGSPEVLFRFRQEVRIAHRITHPNVCRTYHLDHEVRQTGHDQNLSIDLMFLTMEFLEGETLQQVLKRSGRLTPERALQVARQIAEGIDAAHRMGIVHRDIKPGNVMICPAATRPGSGVSGDARQEDRVVVTDFGLAKFEAGAVGGDLSSMSHPGRAMGTLAYMSPEQLHGGEVGPATDIYAFGLVLYEMVTGVKAFPDSGTIAAAFRRATDFPPSPRAVMNELPAAWEVAVLGCLQIEPGARFQHATKVIDILDGVTVQSAGMHLWKRPTTPRSEWQSTWRSGLQGPIGMRRGILGVVMLAVVSLLAGGLRLWSSRGDASVAPGTLVFLAPVKNETGEKPLDNVTELVRAGLEQSAHINLLDSARTGDILQQMTKPPDTVIDPSSAREIAMRAGAIRVVFATVKGAGGKYNLDIDIQQPDSTPKRYRDHWTKSFAWKSDDSTTKEGAIPREMLTAVRAASDWIRHQVGESANDIAQLDVPPGDVTTENWDALEDFAYAERLLAKHDKDAAIRMLQNATEKDPHFALAYATLADNLMSEFRVEEARIAYGKAVAFEQEGRLTSRERYFIVATRANDTEDYQVALDALKNYTDLYPNDYRGWFYLSYPLIELGRAEDAAFALRKAAAVHPDGGAALIAAAVGEISADRIDAARIDVRQAAVEGASDEVPYVVGMINFLEGRFDDAETSFRRLESAHSPVYQAVGYSLLASVMAERDLTTDAIKVLDESIEHSEHFGDKASVTAALLSKAYLLCRLERYQDCFQTLDLDETTTTDPSQIIAKSFVLGTAARSRSAAVRVESASRLQILASLANGQSNDVLAALARLRTEGELQGARGNWRSALEAFRKADRLDATIADRTYLGRALASAAEHEHDSAAARSLRSQAMAAFRRTLQHPGHLWHEAWLYSPGLLADEMQLYLNLCTAGSNDDDFCAVAGGHYRSLRAEQP
jgi:serine/threonine protein kinase/tetratricopeptide (TPR) repeat protein